MYHLNNLDIILLAVVLISGLIALSRGLIKEVLSIIGWVLVTVLIVYLLPVFLPFAKNFINSIHIFSVLENSSYQFWLSSCKHVDPYQITTCQSKHKKKSSK